MNRKQLTRFNMICDGYGTSMIWLLQSHYTANCHLRFEDLVSTSHKLSSGNDLINLYHFDIYGASSFHVSRTTGN